MATALISTLCISISALSWRLGSVVEGASRACGLAGVDASRSGVPSGCVLFAPFIFFCFLHLYQIRQTFHDQPSLLKIDRDVLPLSTILCGIVNGCTSLVLFIALVSLASWTFRIFLLEFHLCCRIFQPPFLLRRQRHDRQTTTARRTPSCSEYMNVYDIFLYHKFILKSNQKNPDLSCKSNLARHKNTIYRIRTIVSFCFGNIFGIFWKYLSSFGFLL